MDRYDAKYAPEEVQLTVLKHLQQEEQKHVLPYKFLKGTGLPFFQRSRLIDRLTAIHSALGLGQASLHLAARLVDAFVVRHFVLPDMKFPLSIACLLIAAKVEDKNRSIGAALNLLDPEWLNPNGHEPEEVLYMERLVLAVLDFRIYRPLPTDFLPALINSLPEDHIITGSSCVWDLANFLLDLTLHDYRMAQFPASMVAASCLYVVCRVIGEYGYPENDGADGSDDSDGYESGQFSDVSDTDMDVGDRDSNTEEDSGHGSAADVSPDDDDMMIVEDGGDDKNINNDADDGDRSMWAPELQHISGYQETDLLPCVAVVAIILLRSERGPYQAARGKHGSISDWEGLDTEVVRTLANPALLNAVPNRKRKREAAELV